MELSKAIAALYERRINPTVGDRRYRFVHLLAILIAILHAAMAVTAVNTKSPTFDEPQHLTAGYSYWVTNDFRLDPENGNLPMRWAALPLLLNGPKFVPLNDRAWQSAHEGQTAHQFFYELGNDPDRVLGDARMMMSIFGAALCLLIFRCAREFFGVLGALLAESIAAFDPNFLAHSALVTSDVPAAFFFTAAIWSTWRLSQKISPTTFVIAALSLAGLFLTKFSAPIVLPIIGVMSIMQIFSRNAITLRFGSIRAELKEKWTKTCAISVSLLVLGATVFFAIWLSFSFRYSAWVDNDERNIHQLAIQATPMKKQAMIAEMLAMIGRNDDQRVVEHPTLRKLVQQNSQLLVEVEDRVVVNVDRHLNVLMGQRGFVKLLPRLENRMIRVGDRPESKSRNRSVRHFVR